LCKGPRSGTYGCDLGNVIEAKIGKSRLPSGLEDAVVAGLADFGVRVLFAEHAEARGQVGHDEGCAEVVGREREGEEWLGWRV